MATKETQITQNIKNNPTTNNKNIEMYTNPQEIDKIRNYILPDNLNYVKQKHFEIILERHDIINNDTALIDSRIRQNIDYLMDRLTEYEPIHKALTCYYTPKLNDIRIKIVTEITKDILENNEYDNFQYCIEHITQTIKKYKEPVEKELHTNYEYVIDCYDVPDEIEHRYLQMWSIQNMYENFTSQQTKNTYFQKLTNDTYHKLIKSIIKEYHEYLDNSITEIENFTYDELSESDMFTKYFFEYETRGSDTLLDAIKEGHPLIEKDGTDYSKETNQKRATAKFINTMNEFIERHVRPAILIEDE